MSKKAGPSKKAKAKASSARPVDHEENRDARTGHFLPGNRAWEARRSAGPKPTFSDSEALWAACVQYFVWVEENPLFDQQIIAYKGTATHVPVPKMRAMTKRGLCRFIGIEHTTWNEDRPDLGPAIERAESVIWDQKFSGAAAGLLNASIISRELGLADRTEMSGLERGAIQFEEVPQPRRPPKEATDRMIQNFGNAIARFGEETSEAREARQQAEQRRLEAIAPETEEYQKHLIGLGWPKDDARREAEFDALLSKYLPPEDAEARRRRHAEDIRRWCEKGGMSRHDK